MKKTRLILVIVLISVVLLSCLGFLGYFGIKTMRRSHLRSEARKAFSAEDWKMAEKLLNEYVARDPDSEEDFVRLAQVYHHLGNTGEEMLCWYKASTLNPLKPEYWDSYTTCAMNAREFSHFYSSFSRKSALNAKQTPREIMLYLISAVMTDHARDAGNYYERIHKADPKFFQKDDLGRFTEFLVTAAKHSADERSKILEQGIQSDDPVVRLESILQQLVDLELSGENTESVDEQEETLLKQAVELNRFAATPLLVSFYFSRLKFGSVIETAEPFLADIPHLQLALVYAESCVYGAQPEKLKPLAQKFHTLGLRHRILASYFDALYQFSLGMEGKRNTELAGLMQKVGSVVQTDLANLVNLQIALNNDSLEKICTTFETIMKNPPFHSVQGRARLAVRQYLWNKINENPTLADDPRVAKLVQFLAVPGGEDPFLMRLMISDLYRRNVLTRQILQDNLEAFPEDPYLLQVAAEFELFHDNPGRCLNYVQRFYALELEERSNTFDLLHMLALELSGKIDEAAKEFAALLENNEMNRELLYRYLMFCTNHKREAELSKMADRLDASKEPDLKALAPFFRAEEMFLQGKTEEALSLLETSKTDQPDFALYAADKFSSCGRVDQALSRYLALVGRHPDRRVVLANIAEVYLAKGMKKEALSYAKQAWEMNHDDGIGQFVYAQMLAENGQYQDAASVLNIPNRKVELPDEIMNLWTDIMHHAIEDSIANQRYMQAEEQCKHLLIFAPDDAFAKENREKARKRIGGRSSEKQNESPQSASPIQK